MKSERELYITNLVGPTAQSEMKKKEGNNAHTSGFEWHGIKRLSENVKRDVGEEDDGYCHDGGHPQPAAGTIRRTVAAVAVIAGLKATIDVPNHNAVRDYKRILQNNNKQRRGFKWKRGKQTKMVVAYVHVGVYGIEGNWPIYKL